jgi:hypothetical protein
METIRFSSRRAILKASVAIAGFAGAGSVLTACSDNGAAVATADPDSLPN